MCALQRSCPTLHRNNINVDSRRVIFYLHSIHYLPCYHLTLFIDDKEGKKIFRLALYIRCLIKEVVGGLALDGCVNLCACPRMCLKWQSWKRKQKNTLRSKTWKLFIYNIFTEWETKENHAGRIFRKVHCRKTTFKKQKGRYLAIVYSSTRMWYFCSWYSHYFCGLYSILIRLVEAHTSYFLRDC